MPVKAADKLHSFLRSFFKSKILPVHFFNFLLNRDKEEGERQKSQFFIPMSDFGKSSRHKKRETTGYADYTDIFVFYRCPLTVFFTKKLVKKLSICYKCRD